MPLPTSILSMPGCSPQRPVRSNRSWEAVAPMTGPDPSPGAGPERAYSPGRGNLIGDHTDDVEGVALPVAVDLGTTVSFVPHGGTRVVLRSSSEPDPADVDVHVALDPRQLQALEPRWARYVAAIVA